MDFNISGSGNIIAGEYEKIRVSGSAKAEGLIRCKSFHCSGSVKGCAEFICEDDFAVSGSVQTDKSITAKEMGISGSASISGDCNIGNEIKASGSLKCGGTVKCGSFKSSGSSSVKGGIEAETVHIKGVINCGGLINAEKVSVEIERDGMRVDSIGGSEITVFTRTPMKSTAARMPLFSKLLGASYTQSFGLTVDNSIEGDTVALEFTKAKTVIGRVIAIGEGCEIELVQYSESIELHPNAKVGKYEKI